MDLLQITTAQLVVAVAGLQHCVADHEHGVSERHHSALDAAPCHQAPELG